MAPHRYAEYSASDIELRYHLHYDHGMAWSAAVALSDEEAVAAHRGAHA